MHRPLALALALVGCAEDGIGAKEQRSVALAVQAIELGALAAELAAPARLALDEDATLCPGMSRIEGYVTVAYGGCVPQRGWVRGAVDGGFRLDLTSDTFSTDLDALAVGPVSVSGTLDGDLEAGGAFGADFDLDGAEIPQARLDLTGSLAGPLSLSGLATLSAGSTEEVVLEGITVATGSGCFAPIGGVARVDTGLVDVTITFQDDGLAAVTNSREQSGDVDVCGLDAGLFGE